jgi:lipopolysaccharide export system permease protein
VLDDAPERRVSPSLLRYVARLYAVQLLGAWFAVVAVFLTADFGDRMKTYLAQSWADVGALYWNKGLVAVHQLGPAAMLLAAGACVSTIRRRGEFTAMRALGLSPLSLYAPIAALALLSGVGLAAFDELVVTQAGPRIDALQVGRFNTWGDFRFFYFPKQWFRIGDFIIQLRGEREGAIQRDVSLYRVSADFALVERIDAATLSHLEADRWLLTQAVVRSFSGADASTRAEQPSLELRVPGSAADAFAIRAGRPELMPVAELLEQRVLRQRAGLPTARLTLALHNRFAYPATGVGAALLAVALALRPNRKGHLTAALVEGLLITAGLWALLVVGKALVLGEHLSAAGAAWGPCVLLLVISGAMAARLHGVGAGARAG